MANEVILHNGYHSKNDSNITGSLEVTGEIAAVTGSFTGGINLIQDATFKYTNQEYLSESYQEYLVQPIVPVDGVLKTYDTGTNPVANGLKFDYIIQSENHKTMGTYKAAWLGGTLSSQNQISINIGSQTGSIGTHLETGTGRVLLAFTSSYEVLLHGTITTY